MAPTKKKKLFWQIPILLGLGLTVVELWYAKVPVPDKSEPPVAVDSPGIKPLVTYWIRIPSGRGLFLGCEPSHHRHVWQYRRGIVGREHRRALADSELARTRGPIRRLLTQRRPRPDRELGRNAQALGCGIRENDPHVPRTSASGAFRCLLA